MNPPPSLILLVLAVSLTSFACAGTSDQEKLSQRLSERQVVRVQKLQALVAMSVEDQAPALQDLVLEELAFRESVASLVGAASLVGVASLEPIEDPELIRWIFGNDQETRTLWTSFSTRPQRFEWWIGLTHQTLEPETDEIHRAALSWVWDGCVEVRAFTRTLATEYERSVVSFPSNVVVRGECLDDIERIPIATVPEPSILGGLVSGALLVAQLNRRERRCQ